MERGPTFTSGRASSHSNLNVTPRPTLRPRHGPQPATANTSPRSPPLHEVDRLDNTVGAPMADVVGPTRRSLAPPANTSPRPPLHEGRFDNTDGAASRKAITSSSDTMRPIRESAQDQPATPPAPTRGTSHPMITRDNWAQQTPIGTVVRVARRPAAATQKLTSSDTTTRQTDRG